MTKFDGPARTHSSVWARLPEKMGRWIMPWASSKRTLRETPHISSASNRVHKDSANAKRRRQDTVYKRGGGHALVGAHVPCVDGTHLLGGECRHD